MPEMGDKQKKQREISAMIYWSLRIRTGTSRDALIVDALAHAPELVEKARLRCVKQFGAFVERYPERAEAL